MSGGTDIILAPVDRVVELEVPPSIYTIEPLLRPGTTRQFVPLTTTAFQSMTNVNNLQFVILMSDKLLDRM